MSLRKDREPVMPSNRDDSHNVDRDGVPALGDHSNRESKPDLERTDTTTLTHRATPSVVIEEECIDAVESAALVETKPLARSSAAPDLDITEKMDARAPSASSDVPGLPANSPLHPLLLQRIEPTLGRGERLRLDATSSIFTIGRAEESDVRLYTASASREHAMITRNEVGDWVLTLSEGTSVLVDGESTTEPVILEVGMNLILGLDHLRCVSEGLDRGGMAARTATEVIDAKMGSRFPGLRRRAARVITFFRRKEKD